jgi:hypothetical protein
VSSQHQLLYALEITSRQATSLRYSTVLISTWLSTVTFPRANDPPTRLVLGNLAAWTHGACIVYAAETYDPAQNLRALIEASSRPRHASYVGT